jgi:heat shock protein 5
MNIEACEKGSGKTEQITIKNDKGRLTSDDIERMVEEAERYKEDDLKVQRKIESKNQLESLLHTAKSSIDGENKSKLEAEEIEVIGNTVKETEEWLLNDELTSEEIDSKYEELSERFKPIMDKIMGPAKMPEGFNMSEGVNTPEDVPNDISIDEVD